MWGFARYNDVFTLSIGIDSKKTGGEPRRNKSKIGLNLLNAGGRGGWVGEKNIIGIEYNYIREADGES